MSEISAIAAFFQKMQRDGVSQFIGSIRPCEAIMLDLIGREYELEYDDAITVAMLDSEDRAITKMLEHIESKIVATPLIDAFEVIINGQSIAIFAGGCADEGEWEEPRMFAHLTPLTITAIQKDIDDLPANRHLRF